MRKHSMVRRSRRAPPLKDSDYDHEIALIDHGNGDGNGNGNGNGDGDGDGDGAGAGAGAEAANIQPIPLSPQQTTLPISSPVPVPEPQPDCDPEPEQTPSSSSIKLPSGIRSPRRSTTSTSTESKKSNKSSKKSRSRRAETGKAVVPTVHINEPTPTEISRPPAPTQKGNRHRRNMPESAIDVLYENERGGILCGLALFSPKALGQLDPPNWTNSAHKPSPTSINTAQVPDPSWTWSWPEWHVNHDVGDDENGWEYSFMFAKAFSWHPPRWYNSFVRRRAWIRQRVKRTTELQDPHMLNTDYFTVRQSMETNRSSSKASSHPGRASVSSWVSAKDGEKPDIEDIQTLMAILKRSRIDREKLEAVDNFLVHGEEDLIDLQNKMHDIMANFIFQASRRSLLFRLNQVYDQALEGLKEKDTGRLQRRSNSLKAAIRHADEECRRLEYWSDIKNVVRGGCTETAADKYGGWDESWRGVDNSGPTP